MIFTIIPRIHKLKASKPREKKTHNVYEMKREKIRISVVILLFAYLLPQLMSLLHLILMCAWCGLSVTVKSLTSWAIKSDAKIKHYIHFDD